MIPAVLGTYRMLCGVPALAQEIALHLRSLGWEEQADAPVTLLLDGPWGVALQGLDVDTTRALVIVTDNPCPEYQEDLWERGPRALLAGGHSVRDIADALQRAAKGEHFRRTPQHSSPLSGCERKLLRFSAMGWENKRIADEFGLTEGTVRNGLSRVFQKLGFENRTQVALYYWGLWHLLDESAPHTYSLNVP